jgi:hypothetical protein
MLKQAKKEIASGAIVHMPSGFKKPLDYSIDLIIRQHPTLREYVALKRPTEVD